MKALIGQALLDKVATYSDKHAAFKELGISPAKYYYWHGKLKNSKPGKPKVKVITYNTKKLRDNARPGPHSRLKMKLETESFTAKQVITLLKAVIR